MLGWATWNGVTTCTRRALNGSRRALSRCLRERGSETRFDAERLWVFNAYSVIAVGRIMRRRRSQALLQMRG